MSARHSEGALVDVAQRDPARQIADLKMALDALGRSEARYRRLFAGLRESVLVFQLVRDDSGAIVDWIIQDANPEAKESCPMGDILGRRASEVFGDAIRPYIRMSNQVVRTGQPKRFEAHLPWNDRYYLMSMFGLDDETLVISKVDITDRKRAEEGLRRARDELEAIIRKRTADLVSSYEELKHRTEQLNRLAGDLTLAEQRERHRLATVLHDHLQQLLVGARLRAELMARSDDTQVRSAATELCELLRESIDETRSLTAEMSPAVLYQNGLAAALKWLGGWMQCKHGLTVDVEPDSVDDLASEDARIMLFQAVRELLFNVVKHAKVHAAKVHVQHLSRRIIVSVIDDGVGFDPAEQAKASSSDQSNSSRFGLFSVRERIESIGGRMEVHSAPGRGTRVCISVPIRKEQAAVSR